MMNNPTSTDIATTVRSRTGDPACVDIRSSLERLPPEIVQMIAAATGPFGRHDMLQALDMPIPAESRIKSTVYDCFKKVHDDHMYAFVTHTGTICTDTGRMRAAARALERRYMSTGQPLTRGDLGRIDRSKTKRDQALQYKTIVITSAASAGRQGGTLCCAQPQGYSLSDQPSHAHLTLAGASTRDLVIDYRDTAWDRTATLPWDANPLVTCRLPLVMGSETVLQLLTDTDGWSMYRTTTEEPGRAVPASRSEDAGELGSDPPITARTHYIGYSREADAHDLLTSTARRLHMRSLADLAADMIWAEHQLSTSPQSPGISSPPPPRIRWVDLDRFRQVSLSPTEPATIISARLEEKLAKVLVKSHLQRLRFTRHMQSHELDELIDTYLDFVPTNEFDVTEAGKLLERYRNGTIDSDL